MSMFIGHLHLFILISLFPWQWPSPAAAAGGHPALGWELGRGEPGAHLHIRHQEVHQRILAHLSHWQVSASPLKVFPFNPLVWGSRRTWSPPSWTSDSPSPRSGSCTSSTTAARRTPSPSCPGRWSGTRVRGCFTAGRMLCSEITLIICSFITNQHTSGIRSRQR